MTFFGTLVKVVSTLSFRHSGKSHFDALVSALWASSDETSPNESCSDENISYNILNKRNQVFQPWISLFSLLLRTKLQQLVYVYIIIMSLHPPQATNGEKIDWNGAYKNNQEKLASKMDPSSKSNEKIWIENSQHSSLVTHWLSVSGDQIKSR